MNIPVSIELLAGILGGLIVSMVVLLLLQVRNSAIVNRIAAPAYEFVQHQAEKESEAIIDEAKRQAATIIANASTENAKVLASYTEHAAELQATYQEHLKRHSEMLTQKMNGAIAVHLEKLESIGETSLTTLEEGRKKLDARFLTVLESFTQTEAAVASATQSATKALTEKVDTAVVALTTSLAAKDAAVTEHLEAHTKAVIAAIDAEVLAYKAARLSILDAHIAQIVEGVTKRVLNKQLTLTEHAELAREALREATKERSV